MIYRLTHRTTYDYADTAETCHNLVRLSPRTLSDQRCLEAALHIDPAPATLHTYVDYFGNRCHSFAVYEPHRRLSISAESLVEITRPPVRALPDSPRWESVRDHLRGDRHDDTIEALEYVFDSKYARGGPALRAYAADPFRAGRPLLEAMLELTLAIHRDFTYDPTATDIDTSVDDVLEKRCGVCQDFAHLAIGCLRSLGLSCRYVSGYVQTSAEPGQAELAGADASHAWVGVYCPQLGWFDFDPTNGCAVADRHVTVGWGRDFHDVSPVKGVVLGGGSSRLDVAVEMVAQ